MQVAVVLMDGITLGWFAFLVLVHAVWMEA
jgi:hypothetical protein